MTTTEEYIAAIRKALEAGPTPGEWKGIRGGKTGLVRGINVVGSVIVRWHGLGQPSSKQGQANAELIAACNPVAISAVLSELDRLKAENERMRAALYDIIGLDHHNMGPESKATKSARAALKGEA